MTTRSDSLDCRDAPARRRECRCRRTGSGSDPGKTVEGMFIGGDSKAVRVLLDNGQRRRGPARRRRSSSNSPPRKPAPPAAPPRRARPPAPKPAPKTVTVPAGTTVNVRLTQAIDVDASQAGMTFKAIVDDPVMVGRFDRHPARRVGGPASRPGAAVGHDERQRQDLAEAELHWVRRNGLRGRHRLRRDQRQGRREEDRAQGRRRRRPRRHRRRYRGRRFEGRRSARPSAARPAQSWPRAARSI